MDNRLRSLLRRTCVLIVTLVTMVTTLVTLCGTSRSQSLLEEMTTEGVQFRQGVKVVLPVPTLTSDAFSKTSDEQTEKLRKQLAGNDSWDRFTRDSVVAPVTIKLEYVIDAAGERVGHSVHSAFIVHAKLDSLGDKELMQQIFGKPESNAGSGMKVTELSEADLKAAQSTAPVTDEKGGLKVTYSQVDFTLLDKIRLNGVLRIERSFTPSSTTIAWILDPHFSANEKLRGTWSKISDAADKSEPYTGWGGYMNVTRVSDSPEMLLIESRMLLHELPEWFSGSNFVRSKLPLVIQEGARNFRRKLKAQ